MQENRGAKTKKLAQEPLLEVEGSEPAVLDIDQPQTNDECPHDTSDLSFRRILPDLNVYQNKKTAGTGMMDVALLVTNVNQLRHIITNFDRNPFSYISISLVISSIILQIVVGFFLIANSRYDVKDCEEVCKADKINNWCTSLIFLITAINVMLSAFEFPDM
jgi:hypothetical protein